MKLSQFLNYFKFYKNGNIKYIPTCWEDDYCQVELIPRENQVFTRQQVEDANLFAEDHKTEFGYTAVFIREGNPIKTISKEIRADYLRSTLISFELPELRRVRYEGGGSKSLRGSKIYAFGIPCFTVFFDTEDEFVKNIWVKFNLITSINEFDIILSSLYNLGVGNDLMLVDWDSDDIIDIQNKNQIRNYLAEWQR